MLFARNLINADVNAKLLFKSKILNGLTKTVDLNVYGFFDVDNGLKLNENWFARYVIGHKKKVAVIFSAYGIK